MPNMQAIKRIFNLTHSIHSLQKGTRDMDKGDAVITDILETDKIPQLIICATMWHETQEEMMEFLKSIVRLDEDQCARRMAKIHINGGKPDDEYYELESKCH